MIRFSIFCTFRTKRVFWFFPHLFGSIALYARALLSNQKKAAFLGATSELSLLSQLGDPFAVVMKEEKEKIWIPSTKLTDDGSFLD